MATKRKKNYLPVILGLVAVGGAAYYFRNDIKRILGFEPKTDSGEIDTFTPSTVVVNAPATTPQVDINAGVIAAPKKTLSPLGTNKDLLLMGEKLELGDQGQEVAKLQQILNRIAEINRTTKVKEDGNFGVGTQAKLNAVFGKGSITLREAYLMLYAIWNATQNKDVKNWYKNYFAYYLTQPERLNEARKRYFANNKLI